jgi:hypothetical protein
MTLNPQLTHELAYHLQNERNAACTEVAFETKSGGAFALVRRAFGARLISLGERLTGDSMAVSAGVS